MGGMRLSVKREPVHCFQRLNYPQMGGMSPLVYGEAHAASGEAHEGGRKLRVKLIGGGPDLW